MDEITSAMLAQIQEVEQKDERQVLAELAGETIAEFIYETEVWDPKSKRKIRKVRLSWVGVREVARSRGNIVLSDPMITDTDDGAVRIVVKATDLTRNFTVFGGCHQPKRMKINKTDPQTGEIIEVTYEDDPHYFPKGLSKAQRNAMNPCIPADYAVKMIDRFLRSSGRPPLLANPADKQRPPAKAPPTKIAPQTTTPSPAPTRQAVNMQKEKWNDITKEQVATYPLLEQVFWDLTKKQPAELYKELGGGTRNDMTIPAWEAFLVLKERFAPTETQPLK